MGLRSRLDDWFVARLPVADTWTLGQRNIYIVPTRGGYSFAALVLLMLLTAINYQLNLGYVLAFLLAGAAVVSMHVTHGMLRGLTLRIKPGPPGWAGDPALLEVVIDSPARQRHALAVRWHRRGGAGQTWTAVDVPGGGQASATLSFVPAHRGWHTVPPIVVETGFPFGFFRAWTVWRPSTRVLAWPRPEHPAPPLPSAQATPGELAVAQRAPGGELDGVRPWRRGDTLRQVVWKKVARSGELVSRETAASGSRELWLDWAATQGDAEARLSRLAGWVEQAEQRGLVWGLRLPGAELPGAQGDAHRRLALERLATWT
jgi:uncharacterized protein (DUF58 family)